jgi:hypothetical protein
LSHSASSFFFVLDIFRIGSQELFAWAGFEVSSSSMPPDLLRLQA